MKTNLFFLLQSIVQQRNLFCLFCATVLVVGLHERLCNTVNGQATTADATSEETDIEEPDEGSIPDDRLASERPKPLPIDMKIDRRTVIPPALTEFHNREIAQTMHYAGAPWLVRESRQREEDCRTLLEALKVQSGDVLCDMGCGNGFYTLELARMVGPEGLVYAVDIQPEMLRMLRVVPQMKSSTIFGSFLERPLIHVFHRGRLTWFSASMCITSFHTPNRCSIVFVKVFQKRDGLY